MFSKLYQSPLMTHKHILQHSIESDNVYCHPRFQNFYKDFSCILKTPRLPVQINLTYYSSAKPHFRHIHPSKPQFTPSLSFTQCSKHDIIMNHIWNIILLRLKKLKNPNNSLPIPLFFETTACALGLKFSQKE
jgi:hypothetical protein